MFVPLVLLGAILRSWDIAYPSGAGTGCAPGTRNLLDLLEVAFDPQNGRAAVTYTDDTITKTSSGAPLPQLSWRNRTRSTKEQPPRDGVSASLR